MTAGTPQQSSEVDDWPQYTVKYTSGPTVPGIDEVFDADDVVLFDPTRKGGSNWIAAAEGSCVPLEETR